MKISETVGPKPWEHAPIDPVIGLDIGSRGSKGVLVTPDSLSAAFIPTGLYMQETADDLLERLLHDAQAGRPAVDRA